MGPYEADASRVVELTSHYPSFRRRWKWLGLAPGVGAVSAAEGRVRCRRRARISRRFRAQERHHESIRVCLNKIQSVA
jgi:hypothetical protein